MRMPRRTHGFTLIELLVAIALLSLVMGGLVSAMRAIAATEERADQRIRLIEDFRTAEKFLRGILGAISPRARSSEPGAAKSIAFDGTNTEVRWVGVMPARHGAGGLYRFRLFVRPATGDERSDLMLSYAPMTNSDAPFDGETEQSRVMVGAVGALSIRYQETVQLEATWLPDWPNRDRLPTRIGLRFGGDDSEWPDIIISVFPLVGPKSVTRAVGAGAGAVIGPF